MTEETNNTVEPEATTTPETDQEEPTILGSAKPDAGEPPAEEPQAAEEDKPSEDGSEEPQPEEWDLADLSIPDEWKEDPDLKTFGAEAKELGLGKEGAQKLLDLYRQRRENEYKEFVETRKRWAEESKRILGENAPEKLATIAKALEGIDPKVERQFREILDATAVGDHPAVVQVMYELAKRAVGGGLAQGQPAAPTKKRSLTEIFGYEQKE